MTNIETECLETEYAFLLCNAKKQKTSGFCHLNTINSLEANDLNKLHNAISRDRTKVYDIVYIDIPIEINDSSAISEYLITRIEYGRKVLDKLGDIAITVKNIDNVKDIYRALNFFYSSWSSYEERVFTTHIDFYIKIYLSWSK